MNCLIKTFLIRRTREQGFAIPIVIALGLIMILIGMVNIVKSNEEEIIAIGQRGTHRALTAAEAGVAYYRDFINKNRAIAIYPACKAELEWNDSDNEWTCSDSGTTISWANNADKIPGIDDTCDFSGFGSTAVQDATVNIGWQNVNNNPDLGQYRLVSYTYSNADDLGTLIVEGRDSSSNNASMAKLKVEFDVQSETTDNLNNLSPVLWIGSETITLNSDNNNLQVDNGNILITKLDCQLSSGVQTIANALGKGTVYPSNLLLTPQLPTTFNEIDNANDIIITDPTNLDEVNTKSLPRGTDQWVEVNGKPVYYYLIKDDLELNGDYEIRIGNGSKVIFLVQGNITFNGNVNINQNATSNTSDLLEIYGNSVVGGSNRFNCATGVTCPTNTITFDGAGKTINIKAFIHAPDSTVTVSANDPTINITGAIWVNAWNDPSSATNKITITPDDRYLNYTSIEEALNSNSLIVRPIFHPPSKWETVETE